MDSCGRWTRIYVLSYRDKKCLKKLAVSARINVRLRRIAGIDSLSEHKDVVDEQDDIQRDDMHQSHITVLNEEPRT
jgi:hypothetical protein